MMCNVLTLKMTLIYFFYIFLCVFYLNGDKDNSFLYVHLFLCKLRNAMSVPIALNLLSATQRFKTNKQTNKKLLLQEHQRGFLHAQLMRMHIDPGFVFHSSFCICTLFWCRDTWYVAVAAPKHWILLLQPFQGRIVSPRLALPPNSLLPSLIHYVHFEQAQQCVGQRRACSSQFFPHKPRGI